MFSPAVRTKDECEKINERARNAGYQTTLRLGPNANEARLKAATSPRILHIATHGFYYSFTSEEAPTSRLSDNPHNASGIALAGANTTVRAWSAGKIPATFDDGIVTALEASRLDLSNTDLTVLSSCNSASGHQVSGIGVIGLRGALYQAGTRNLLVTLWRVDDEQSLKFMIEFYDRFFREDNVQTAFSGTQRQFLSAFRLDGKPKNIRRAVQYFGPFLLSATDGLAH
jgi:CHAT domain-containing protein